MYKNLRGFGLDAASIAGSNEVQSQFDVLLTKPEEQISPM